MANGGARPRWSGGRLFGRAAVSVLIAVLFLWLTWRGLRAEVMLVSDGRSALETIWEAATSVPLSAIALYALLFLALHVVRLVRWAFQVRPLGERDTLKVLRIGAVGNAAIVALPLRLGELVRPALLARESHVRFSAAMGTAVVERVVDGLVLVLMLGASLLLLPEPTPLLRNAAIACAVLFVGAAMAVAAFVISRSVARRVLQATVGRVLPRAASRIDALLEDFVDGCATLRRGGGLWAYLGLTLLYWWLNVVSLVLLARAFGFALGWWEGAAVLAILVAGILLPAGPGYFGNFQLFLAEGLRLVLPGVLIGAAGLAFALIMNLVQVAVQLLVAVPALPATGLRSGALVALEHSALRAAEESAGAGSVEEAVAEQPG